MLHPHQVLEATTTGSYCSPCPCTAPRRTTAKLWQASWRTFWMIAWQEPRSAWPYCGVSRWRRSTNLKLNWRVGPGYIRHRDRWQSGQRNVKCFEKNKILCSAQNFIVCKKLNLSIGCVRGDASSTSLIVTYLDYVCLRSSQNRRLRKWSAV